MNQTKKMGKQRKRGIGYSRRRMRCRNVGTDAHVKIRKEGTSNNDRSPADRIARFMGAFIT